MKPSTPTPVSNQIVVHMGGCVSLTVLLIRVAYLEAYCANLGWASFELKSSYRVFRRDPVNQSLEEMLVPVDLVYTWQQYLYLQRNRHPKKIYQSTTCQVSSNFPLAKLAS